MLRRAALGLTALALVHGAALGQTTLQWKFKEGDKFYVEEKMVSKNTTVVAGTTTVQEQTETRISSFLVKSRTKDGVILMGCSAIALRSLVIGISSISSAPPMSASGRETSADGRQHPPPSPLNLAH